MTATRPAKDLHDELKMARPFKTVEQELLLNIVRTAAVLEHDMGEALKPFGLTPTQYNVLRILRGAGAAAIFTSMTQLDALVT